MLGFCTDVKDELVAAMQQRVVEMFGKDPRKSESFGRIVNSRHWDRIARLVRAAQCIGGRAWWQTRGFRCMVLMEQSSLVA